MKETLLKIRTGEHRTYKLTDKFLVQTDPGFYGEEEACVWQLELKELNKRLEQSPEGGGTNDSKGITLKLIGNVSGKKLRASSGFYYNTKDRRIGCATFSKKQWEKILEAAKVKRG